MKARLIKAKANTDDATPAPQPEKKAEPKPATQPVRPAQRPLNPRAEFEALFAKK